MHGLIIGGGQKMGQSSLPTHYWIKPNKKEEENDKKGGKNHHSQQIIG